MPQQVEISLTEQINDGSRKLYVELWVYDDNFNFKKMHKLSYVHFQKIHIRKFVHPIPDNLKNSLWIWQMSYRAILGDEQAREELRKRKIKINCKKSYETLKTELNNWLQSEDGWQEIQNYLEQYLNESQEEIQVTIQTENDLLRELPWEEWNIFTSRYAEIALSPSEYEPPEGWKGVRRQLKIRILLVLGADLDINNSNINIELDEKLVNKLEEHGAVIRTLRQRSRQDLLDTLGEPQGWHILFFAGHSETKDEEGDKRGILYLNNNGEYITIDYKDEELQTAFRSVQIAIFNSCDGLGIANQLAKLRLPQCLVMKEPVEDNMATDFLEHFLDAFSRNNSLFSSVHQARNKLQKKYTQQYPGAHSLPVIVSNPAVELPKWKDLIAEYQFPRKFVIPLTLVAILGVIGLPVSIWLEFPDKFLLYAKLYPHIILYPFIAFWAALRMTYKAFCQIMKKRQRQLQISVFLALMISTFLLFGVELSGSDMLLFELQPNAQTKIENISLETREKINLLPLSMKNKIINQDTVNINKAILEESLLELLKPKNKISSENIIGYQSLMKLGLDYNQAWKINSVLNWFSRFSISRCFYALTYWMIVFTVLMFFALWIWIQTQEYDTRKFYNLSKCLTYISLAQIMILLWIPLRFYNLIQTKNLIFGYSDIIKYQDLFIYPTVFVLLVTTVVQVLKIRQKCELAIMTVCGVGASLYLGLEQTDLIDRLFGLKSTGSEIIWFFWPIFVFICLSVFINKNFIEESYINRK